MLAMASSCGHAGCTWGLHSKLHEHPAHFTSLAAWAGHWAACGKLKSDWCAKGCAQLLSAALATAAMASPVQHDGDTPHTPGPHPVDPIPPQTCSHSGRKSSRRQQTPPVVDSGMVGTIWPQLCTRLHHILAILPGELTPSMSTPGHTARVPLDTSFQSPALRPKTSRKTANPSPDVFSDYVSFGVIPGVRQDEPPVITPARPSTSRRVPSPDVATFIDYLQDIRWQADPAGAPWPPLPASNSSSAAASQSSSSTSASASSPEAQPGCPDTVAEDTDAIFSEHSGALMAVEACVLESASGQQVPCTSETMFLDDDTALHAREELRQAERRALGFHDRGSSFSSDSSEAGDHSAGQLTLSSLCADLAALVLGGQPGHNRQPLVMFFESVCEALQQLSPATLQDESVMHQLAAGTAQQLDMVRSSRVPSVASAGHSPAISAWSHDDWASSLPVVHAAMAPEAAARPQRSGSQSQAQPSQARLPPAPAHAEETTDTIAPVVPPSSSIAAMYAGWQAARKRRSQ